MTTTTSDPAPADDRQALAEELALLTMLGDKVTEQIKARKAIIETTWTGGSSVTVELPTDNPARPLKVGTVRADGGQGVARVADRDAWIAWCVTNSPHNVVRQEESKTSWQLDEASRDAVALAVKAHEESNGFGADRQRAFLDALEDRGYTLTRRTTIPAETLVRPAWESETLKLTQAAGTPVAPTGEIPAGIEFTDPPRTVKPVVTIGKDDGMRARFVAEQRHKLAAITGSIINPTEETP